MAVGAAGVFGVVCVTGGGGAGLAAARDGCGAGVEGADVTVDVACAVSSFSCPDAPQLAMISAPASSPTAIGDFIDIDIPPRSRP